MLTNLLEWYQVLLEVHGIPLGAKVMQTLESNIKGISTSNTSGGGISNVMSVNGGDAEIGWSYAHTVANGLECKR